MTKITVQIEGMRCGMCESHMNQTIYNAFPIKKVTSSHRKGQSVIVTEQDIDEQALKKAIESTGYEVKGIVKEPYVKKGFFGWRNS